MSLLSAIGATFTHMFRYTVLYIKQHAFMVAWIIVNLFIFGYSYLNFHFNPAYHYTHQTIGHGLFISRGTASVLNFSCFIVFIPMCRTLLTPLRSLATPSVSPSSSHPPATIVSPTKPNQSSPSPSTAIIIKLTHLFRSTVNRLITAPINNLLISLIDSSQKIHINAAYTICFSGLIHSIAHIINSIQASVNYNHLYPAINLAAFPGQHPFLIISGSVAGVTGIAMNLVLILIVITSSRSIRKSHYNLFKYTHYLTLLFVILILCHPLGGLLKEQTNLDEHSIGCDERRATYNSTEPSSFSEPLGAFDPVVPCAPPKFKPLDSCTWIWLSISLTLYSIDLMLRLWRRRKSIVIINSSVNEDHINIECAQVKGNKSIVRHSLPGQYVYLKCPQISTIEWHPFSLSSIPVAGLNETFNLNIKLNGDWTHRLGDLINERKHNSKDLKLYIDGPFSSPLQDLFSRKICVCIAGGIGATPFISFLSMLRTNQALLSCNQTKLENLHFIWICRNLSNLSGFVGTLASVYTHFQFPNKSCKQPNGATGSNGPAVRMTIYLTQETQETMVHSLNGLPDREAILINRVLCHSIYLGRPVMSQIFHQLHQTFPNEKVSIFSSGPPGLRKEIKSNCIGINLTGPGRFVFKHEDFGI